MHVAVAPAHAATSEQMSSHPRLCKALAARARSMRARGRVRALADYGGVLQPAQSFIGTLPSVIGPCWLSTEPT